jgi:hypothetical protein
MIGVCTLDVACEYCDRHILHSCSELWQSRLKVRATISSDIAYTTAMLECVYIA